MFTGPTINESAVEIIYVYGNNSYVNRSVSNTTQLTILVNDTENGTIVSNANVTFWVNTGSGYDSGNQTQTNATGHATVYFDPDCNYAIGAENWIAGTTDLWYEYTNSTTLNLTAIGNLEQNMILPSGEYLRGYNVTVRINLTDECKSLINDADVFFNYSNPSYEYNCTPIENEGDGYYNCTFNTTDPNMLQPMYWNTTTHANRSYFNGLNDTEVNAFFVETKPTLFDPKGSPINATGDIIAGWGEIFNFSINFTDEDFDTNTLRLYLRQKPSGNWQLKNQTAVSGYNVTINLTSQFTSGASMGDWEYRFTTTADDAWDTYNSTDNNFTVEEDDVYVELLFGNASQENSTIHRNASSPNNTITFAVRVWDTDRNVTISDYITTRFYSTTNTYNMNDYTLVNSVSNDTGSFYINFDPDCSYSIGIQNWKAESVFGSSWYKRVNSTIFNYTIITDQLNATLLNPDNITVVRGLDDILLRGYANDDCGLVNESDTVTFSITRNLVEFLTCSAYDETTGYYNCTVGYGNHTGWSTGWYNVTLDVSEQYYNDSNTEIRNNSFRLVSQPRVFNPQTNKVANTGGWGESWDYSVEVQDEDGDDVNVSLWFDLGAGWQFITSQICVSCDGGASHLITFSGYNFSCDNIGSRTFKVNVTDIYNYSNGTSDTFELEKDDVSIFYGEIGQDAAIDREYNDSDVFGIRIRDTDINLFPGDVIPASTGYISFTTNGTEYDSGNQNTTNTNGYLYYDFDPHCNYSSGAQSWKGMVSSDTCYKDTESATWSHNITAQLRVNVTAPDYGDNVPVGYMIDVNSTVYDECGIFVNSSTVTHEARSPNLEYEPLNVSEFGGGAHNGTWDTSFHMGGDWSFRINASKNYFYSNSTIFVDWVYLNNTPSNATSMSVSPGTGGWGTNYTYQVYVNDSQQDDVTCNLYTYTGTQQWEYRASNTVSGGIGVCEVNITNFTCADISSNVWFLFEIDDGTNVYNTSNMSGPTLNRDSMIVEYLTGNNTIVNRSGSQETEFLLKLYDNTSKGYVTSDVNGTFWVTTDGESFGLDNDNITNSTGHLRLYFNPTGDYNPGRQNWTGGVNKDNCYYSMNVTDINGNVSLMNVTVMADMTISLTTPSPGYNVLRGRNVTFIANIIDDLSVAVTGASPVNLTLLNNNSQQYNCSYVSDEGGGDYRCEINTSNPEVMPARFYNLSIIAQKPYHNNETQIIENSIFIETKPQMTNNNVTSDQGGTTGGWGETWYFNVTITDEDLDNVTLYLQLKKYTDPASSWTTRNTSSYANNPDLRGPINNTITLTYKNPSIFRDEQGVWEYKFIAEDQKFYNSTTTPANFTIEKNDVTITIDDGDASSTFRHTNDYVNLTVNITDTDQNIVVSDLQITFWITTNASDIESFDTGTLVDPNENGTSRYPFDPDCTYHVGAQRWRAGTPNNTYYKDINSTNNSITLYTFLGLNVTSPDGGAYLIGSQLPFYGRVYDECYNVSGATVTFTDKFGASQYSCAPVEEDSNGLYNCTFDTTNKPFDFHDIQMTGSKQYYGDYPTANTTLKEDAYFLASQPSLSTPSVDPILGGWGERYTFSLTLTDRDKNWNNVTVWKSNDTVNWDYVNSTMVKPDWSNYAVDVTKIFICSDFLNTVNGTVFYKLNSTDYYNFSTETSTYNFTLEEDDVALTPRDDVSDTIVRRITENTAMFRFRLYDTDLAVEPNNTNGTVFITLDGSDFTFNQTCLTSEANCTINYNATCNSDVGVQYWYAQATDQCYKPVESVNRSFTVIGQLNITITTPPNSSIMNRGIPNLLNSTVIDECSIEINNSFVSWTNVTNHTIGNGSNMTWNTPVNYDLGNETIKANTTLQYYDPDNHTSDIQIFGWSNMTYLSPANNTILPAGTNQDIVCIVEDANLSTFIENQTVHFYRVNSTGDSRYLGNDTTNGTGVAQGNWSTNDDAYGIYDIVCNITAEPSIYYNASYYELRSTVNLTKQLIIVNIAVDNSTLYRNDSANEPYSANISVIVKDALIGFANGANVSFFNSTEGIGSCLTNSSGVCSIVYNPDDSLIPDLRTIYINATKAESENSETNTTTIAVIGILYINITAPINGTTQPKSTGISVNSTIWTENYEGEPTSTLVQWYIGNQNVINGTNTTISQSIVAVQATGENMLLVNASKNYYVSSINNVTIIITSLANVSWDQPDSGSTTSYPQAFDIACLVSDQESGQPVEGYLVNFTYQWAEGAPVFNGTYITNSTGHATYTFKPSQKGYITFNCTIGDNTTQYYTGNVVEDNATFLVSDISSPTVFNGSVTPNITLEANLNETNITATVTDNFNISYVWAYILLPNGSYTNVTMTNITEIYEDTENETVTTTYRTNYTPKIGGTHFVTVYARDSPPENNTNFTFIGNFTALGNATGYIIQCINYTLDGDESDCDSSVTASGISQVRNVSFVVKTNFTNIGPTPAYNVNLTLSESPIDSMVWNETIKFCGNLTINASCYWEINLTVPTATTPGVYYAYTIASWKNPDNVIDSMFNTTIVTVSQNPIVNITQDMLTASAPHNRTIDVGNITIWSQGNYRIENVTSYWYGVSHVPGTLDMAIDCPSCVLNIIPDVYGAINPGENQTANIELSVPLSQAPGNYLAKLRARTNNAGYDETLINITIPENLSWDRTPSSGTFGYFIQPPNSSGTIGNILVENQGNERISFTVYISGGGGYIYLSNQTPSYAFDLEKQTTTNISVTFDIPAGVSHRYYDVSLNIETENLTGIPPNRSVSFGFNVTDIPPTIENVSVTPTSYELDFENISITANVVDNIKVDKVWINVSTPDGYNETRFMTVLTDDTYNTTYNVTVVGTYSIRVCANDTSTLQSCTDYYNISSSNTTIINITTNTTTINATNITFNFGQEFDLSVILENVGGSRAYNVSVNTTISNSGTLNITPRNYNFSEILKYITKTNNTIVNITRQTLPGLYYVNFTLNWTNMENSTNQTNHTIWINVTENPYLETSESELYETITDGAGTNDSFTLWSLGNINATNITVVCIEGTVCDNFSVTIVPGNLSLLGINTSTTIEVNFSVPSGFYTGIYNGSIEINWTGQNWPTLRTMTLPLTVNVPVNLSWIETPTYLSKSVLNNQTGVFGQVTFTNTGNSAIPLDLIVNESIAPYLTLSHTNITIGFEDSVTINVNFSSPDNLTENTINLTGFLQGNLTGALRENSSITETSSRLSLVVDWFDVKIIDPTQQDPFMGINPNDTMIVKVNVTNNETLTENVTFEAILYDGAITGTGNVTNYHFNNTQQLWILNFSAPFINTSRIYHLNITATHNDTNAITGRMHIKSDIENDSVIYNDTTSPVIVIDAPTQVIQYTDAIIYVNVTEAGGINTTLANVTTPGENGTTTEVNMTLLSRNIDFYIYTINFTNTTIIGVYTVASRICDKTDNCASDTGTFELFREVNFYGNVVDIEDTDELPIITNFRFMDSSSGQLRYSFITNTSDGAYNETLDVTTYDIEVKTINQTHFINIFNLSSITLSSAYEDPVTIGNIPSLRTTTTALKGVYFDTDLSYSSGEAIIDFSSCTGDSCGTSIGDPARLGIYRYSGAWIPKITTADNTLWTRVTNADRDNSDGSIDMSALTAKISISDAGAYILAEFICGDDTCETSYGEDNDNCPADCPTTPVTPGGGDEGGGGSEGGAGTSGTGATTTTTTTTSTQTVPQVVEGEELVPIEVRSDLIETEIIQNEAKMFSTTIQNNQDKSVTATVTIEGPAFALLTVQKPVFTLDAKSVGTVNVRAFAPETIAEGLYTGEIVVQAGEVTIRTPITIKVISLLEKLLDVKVKALSKFVEPGEDLVFEVTLINMGETAEVNDITATYNVRPLSDQEDDTKIIITNQETIAVTNILTFRQTMTIPDDAPEGRYIIEVATVYSNGNKQATAADDIEITREKFIAMLRSTLTNPFILFAIIAGIPAVILGRKWLVAYKSSKKAKARYIAPVDFKALPKPGPNAFAVGKIAETNRTAYADMSQLLMHSIAAGGTGSGKSVSAQVCTEELLKRKIPIIVFDPTAQWTGFMKPCKLKLFHDLYPQFGLKSSDARSFKTDVILVEDENMPINIKDHMKPGEITVFVMNRLPPDKLDKFVKRSIQAIFDMRPKESKKIELMVIYDEVHRLLPKYGGKKGYTSIERACREFRKWGIGVFLISQVLLDFKGAIRANIANEIQLRTKYEGDIGRVKSKYGLDYASKITRLTIGTGLFQNPEFNDGRPWFINFRPLLHSPFALTDKELDKYMQLKKKIQEIDSKIEELKKKKVDTYDIEIELNIARDKLKTAAFKMAETYLDSVEKRVSKMK
ncbi:helicase HerA domain-containing protein [Candidatus Aenigmatarchaeota archaeon]